MEATSLPITIESLGAAKACDLTIKFDEGYIMMGADSNQKYLALTGDDKDKLVLQKEPFGNWKFYKINQEWTLEYYLQTSYTKLN